MGLLWLHDGIHLTALAVAVFVLRAEVRWIKHWCKDHKEDDERNFDRLDTDIRELRKRP